MAEPTFNDIEAEFGVRITRSGERSGLSGWFETQVPGTKVWVRGVDAQDLRDELIKAARMRDDADEARARSGH